MFNLNPRDGVVEIMKSEKLLFINQLFVKETAKLMFRFSIMAFSLGLSVFLRPKDQIMCVQDRPVTNIHHSVDYQPPSSR